MIDLFLLKMVCLLLEKSLMKFYYQETTLPPAAVGAFAVFEGPTPLELTADTLMTYVV